MAQDTLRQVAVCDQKKAYRSEEAARLAARETRRTWGGVKLRSYRCDICGQWHLTKKSGAR